MIYVMLAEGFEEIEALSFVDILRRADIEVKTISITDSIFVTGAHKIKVEADMMLRDIISLVDGIVLPGGLPGTANLKENKKVIEMLKYYNECKKYVAAICAAPSILGEIGLLNGKKSVCYPSYEEYLKGSTVLTDRVVADGNIITSRGAGTAHDFAFKFVELIKGKDIADKIRSSMLYDI